MSEKIPVPRDMVEEILGYGTEDEPRVLGEVSFEALRDAEGETVQLTLAQVGDLFRWAWQDADEWFDLSKTFPDTNPVAYAFDHGIEGSDRLRGLFLWAVGHIDQMYLVKPSTFFEEHREGRDCVVLRCKGGTGLKYATLERVAGSKVLGTEAHWVVRRLDWLLPQEGRDPRNNPATTEEEVREMCDCLTRLNAEIRRGVDR